MLKVRAYDPSPNDIHENYLSRIKNFALVELKPRALNQMKNPIHLILTIDVSGSMAADDSKSQKSKLDYVKTTVSSIITYLRGLPEYDIVISIIAFNDKAKRICSYLRVSELGPDDVERILSSMKADGCTNIGDALGMGNDLVRNFPQFFGSHQPFVSKYSEPKAFKTVNILLTDGEITDGEKRPERLIALLSEKMELSLLGYGDDHDPILLNQLSQLSKGNYTFVDSYEFAGAVYGEVLSSVLNPAWEDITIQIEEGNIYNYEKDEWTDSLFIPRIGDEEQKSFTCRLNPNSVVQVSYRDVTGPRGVLSQEILTLSQNFSEFIRERSASLKLYWLRHLTMEVMHIVLFSDKHSSEHSGGELDKRCKQMEMYHSLFERKYDIELTSDEAQLLKSLRDDIYIAKKCIQAPKQKSALYLGARMRAQGGQRAYNVTNTAGLSEENDGYQMSQARVSTFASPSAVRVMKTVSKMGGQDLDE